MQPTSEQFNIINSEGNIKINAVAGSGKTTTLIEYAKRRPVNSRILYLAFNKSVRLEATRKFESQGLKNVQIETAHSLAYSNVIRKYGYKINPAGYKTHEIKDILNLKGFQEKHTEFVLSKHINKFATYFCNSNKEKVQDLNYLDIVKDQQAKTFVTNFYDEIIKQARALLAKMDKGEINVTHDFYLKKFQLSNPKLSFDYILFDEGQDASPAMLDVFLKQNATKVIVGDTHQQIYGWRQAVNSLEQVDFKDYSLNTSFRFHPEIALLAMKILDWKKYFMNYSPLYIYAAGEENLTKVKATIARTNLALLAKAIELVVEKEEVKKVYFEGNFNSYTYAEDGASIYDVYNLYLGKRSLIRDKLIGSMASFDELEEYADKTEDVELKMIMEVINKYGKDVPELIKKIKEHHVADEEKGKAEMIFSTVHRCKGMEYDEVTLLNDFIKEEDIKEMVTNGEIDENNAGTWAEEINLLYVAVTRSKNKLNLPEELWPKRSKIKLIEAQVKQESPKSVSSKVIIKNDLNLKSYTLEDKRKQNKNAYQPWTQELDDELTRMFCNGKSVKEMAAYFGRNEGSIFSRIKKLELREKYS